MIGMILIVAASVAILFVALILNGVLSAITIDSFEDAYYEQKDDNNYVIK